MMASAFCTLLKPLEGNVTVNTSELGFAGKDIKNFTVKLEKIKPATKLFFLNRRVVTSGLSIEHKVFVKVNPN